MLGYISIFHLINDALKAELEVFQDKNKYRLLWQEYVSGQKNNPGFLNPATAFYAMQKTFPEEVRNDWRQLESFSKRHQMKMPISFFIQKFPQEHETRFFLCLFWQTLEMQYQMIQYSMRTSSLDSKIQYEVMTFMVHLEQWMDDNQSLMQFSSKKRLRSFYQQILAYNWLRTHQSASLYIHTKSLRYFKEELEEVIGEEGDISKLFSYSDPLKQQTENEKAETKAPEGSLYTILDEMTKDIQQLHQDVKQKAEDLQMYEDRFLKPKEVTKLLGISNQTLNNWRKAGKFKNLKDVGNRFEYGESEIREMIKKTQKQRDI